MLHSDRFYITAITILSLAWSQCYINQSASNTRTICFVNAQYIKSFLRVSSKLLLWRLWDISWAKQQAVIWVVKPYKECNTQWQRVDHNHANLTWHIPTPPAATACQSAERSAGCQATVWETAPVPCAGVKEQRADG